MPVERTAPAPPLAVGDPVPWFTAESIGDRPSYVFQNSGGRTILFGLIGSSASPVGRAMLAFAKANEAAFGGSDRGFLALTLDPADRAALARAATPAMRFLLDSDGSVSRRFGALVDGADGKARYAAFWLVLDSAMRVVGRFAPGDGAAALDAMSAPRTGYGPAPILVLPRIFEPDLCRALIDGYRADGGRPSGFMRDVDGVTRELRDDRHKRRSDWAIEDKALRDAISQRILRRLVPEIAKAFHFAATRIERHLVACYDAGEGGYFRQHRDNSSFGTAHRRFAVTINLNADDYDGGDLRFPEYGADVWRASTGGAVIFSCSILHEATSITRGTRYCYLTFLYDDEGARVRATNNPRLGAEVGAYRGA